MRKKTAYLVGIKGVAMTALAVYLKEKGFSVTGSDVPEEFVTDEILKKNKIPVKKGFSPENIDIKYDLVAVTGAHGGMTNPEATRAKEMGLPVYMHGEILGRLMEEQEGISVAGCHGKTTTSAMLASILVHAGLDPSYAVGTARINDLGNAGHFGHGKFFVAEADEYLTCPFTCRTPRFLWQKPKILLVTNIDYDHPDAYKDIEDVRSAFRKLAENTTDDGTIVACIDNENIVKILPDIGKPVVTYGFSPRAQYRIIKAYFGEGISFMRVIHQGMDLGEFMVKLSGRHNLLNALGAAIAANLAGVGWTEIKEHLKKFSGTKRRLEKIGETRKILFYDDYAHHPNEIIATLEGVKSWFPQRHLVVIFQPHTYSRTKSLFIEFTKAFKAADTVIITDIYPSAREKFDPSINSKMLVKEINKHKNQAVYLPDKEKTIAFLEKNVREGSLILTMGAGDVYIWQKDLMKRLIKHAK